MTTLHKHRKITSYQIMFETKKSKKKPVSVCTLEPTGLFVLSTNLLQ